MGYTGILFVRVYGDLDLIFNKTFSKKDDGGEPKYFCTTPKEKKGTLENLRNFNSSFT